MTTQPVREHTNILLHLHLPGGCSQDEARRLRLLLKRLLRNYSLRCDRITIDGQDDDDDATAGDHDNPTESPIRGGRTEDLAAGGKNEESTHESDDERQTTTDTKRGSGDAINQRKNIVDDDG